MFSYDEESHTVKVFNESYSPRVEKPEEMMSHAASLRRSREKETLMEQ